MGDMFIFSRDGEGVAEWSEEQQLKVILSARSYAQSPDSPNLPQSSQSPRFPDLPNLPIIHIALRAELRVPATHTRLHTTRYTYIYTRATIYYNIQKHYCATMAKTQ